MPETGDMLLEIEGLKTYFHTEDGIAKAVDGVTFSIPRGKTVALVGESGCGKSVTSLSILRLISEPAGKIVDGRIVFNGQNLLELTERRMRQIRGDRIAMIFQEPMTAMNPVYTVGNQIIEAIKLHLEVPWNKRRDLAEQLMRRVGIPEPAARLKSYPHHLSGGMRQRAMIAMALACQPNLLIADEPTTALDVTIQAQILELMQEIQTSSEMSILLITHDLSVVAQVADQVVVMYAGRIAERADVHELFKHPLHPYTVGLFQAIPKLGRGHQRLKTIPGQVPNPIDHPTGCRFHPRCPICNDDPRCKNEQPPLAEHGSNHFAACWHLD